MPVSLTEKSASSPQKLCFVLFTALKPAVEPQPQAPYRVTSAGPQQPHPRPFHDAMRARKPPIPTSGETVSKRVLSAQPRYQPIRVDEIMAKAGTLTWVVKQGLFYPVFIFIFVFLR